MIVTCPACKRRYRLDESLIKSPYQKMRCSRCGNVFINQQDENKTAGMKTTLGPSPDGPNVANNSEQPEAAAPKRRSKGMIFLVVLLVCFGLALAGYIYWMNYLGAGNRWLSIRKMVGQEAIVKDGRAFVINGTVLNGSTKARKRIVLKAKLFDEQGAVIGEYSAAAGMTLTPSDVETMEKPAIEEKMAEARSTSGPAQTLYPHKEMPFSIVFPGSYTGKPKYFTVEITDSPFL